MNRSLPLQRCGYAVVHSQEYDDLVSDRSIDNMIFRALALEKLESLYKNRKEELIWTVNGLLARETNILPPKFGNGSEKLNELQVGSIRCNIIQQLRRNMSAEQNCSVQEPCREELVHIPNSCGLRRSRLITRI